MVHIKSKIRENRTRFHNNETPKKDSNYICSALIRIQSIYFKSEELKYYPQVFLEVCRYRLDNGGLRIDASDESDGELILNMNLIIMIIMNLKNLLKNIKRLKNL